MEVKDIFGSGEAINKLIETVEKAVGWFCASIKKKRDTKGSVEEIRCICDVVRDNIDIPIKYEKNGITIDTTNMQEVLVRSTQRQMYQEYIKEINIEAIVEKTADKLQSIQAVSDSPVNTAWANSFFDSAGYIDDPELQDFWAKMLASEVIEPGCISKRTLEVVKQLSIEEVKLFDKVVQYVLYFEDCTNSVIDYIIPRDERILSHINISTPDLITLEEAGLVANSANIEERFILNKSEIKNLYAGNDKAVIVLINQKDEPMHFNKTIYLLSATGREIYNVVYRDKINTDRNDYYKAVENYFYKDDFEELWNGIDDSK